MLDRIKLPQRFGRDMQLLAQFAVKALDQSFAFLALATGEFPVSAKGVVGLALRDENVALSDNDSDGGVDGWFGGAFGRHCGAAECI